MIKGNDPKLIAQKLAEIEDKTRTHGLSQPIGKLYGFDLLVKTESSQKDGFDFIENRFFVRGEGNILYNFNNGRLAKTQRPPPKCSSAPSKPFPSSGEIPERHRKDFKGHSHPSGSRQRNMEKRKTSSNSSNPTLPPPTARSSSPETRSSQTEGEDSGSTRKKTGTKANPRTTPPTLPHQWRCSKHSPPHRQHHRHRQQLRLTTSPTSTSRPTIFPPLRKRSP